MWRVVEAMLPHRLELPSLRARCPAGQRPRRPTGGRHHRDVEGNAIQAAKGDAAGGDGSAGLCRQNVEAAITRCSASPLRPCNRINASTSSALHDERRTLDATAPSHRPFVRRDYRVARCAGDDAGDVRPAAQPAVHEEAYSTPAAPVISARRLTCPELHLVQLVALARSVVGHQDPAHRRYTHRLLATTSTTLELASVLAQVKRVIVEA